MDNVIVGDKEFELFLDQDAIAKRIRLLGIQINVDYEEKTPLFIGVLNGSFLFMADLVKEIEGPCEVAFTKVSSYHGTESVGKITEQLPLPNNLAGRDIILVEDIVDTGLTLKYILEKVWLQQPKSVAVCSLLLKPQAVKHHFEELKYIGFEIPNEFVVGYGLDYDGLGRNLTEIYKVVD